MAESEAAMSMFWGGSGEKRKDEEKREKGKEGTKKDGRREGREEWKKGDSKGTGERDEIREGEVKRWHRVKSRTIISASFY